MAMTTPDTPALAAPPEGEADQPRCAVCGTCGNLYPGPNGKWYHHAQTDCLTSLTAALAAASARADRAERLYEEAKAIVAQSELAERLAQAEAERMRGEVARLGLAVTHEGIELTKRVMDRAIAARPAPGEPMEPIITVAEAERRVEEMRDLCLLPIITAKHEAERQGFESDAAYLDAILRQIRAIPRGDVAAGIPGPEMRCLGCGMYGGAHRDCPAPKLVEVHEWDRIRGADAIPAPAPSDEGPWVVWSVEHGAYWGPEQRGYTSLLYAGVYTRKQAEEIARDSRGREVARPLLAEMPSDPARFVGTVAAWMRDHW